MVKLGFIHRAHTNHKFPEHDGINYVIIIGREGIEELVVGSRRIKRGRAGLSFNFLLVYRCWNNYVKTIIEWVDTDSLFMKLMVVKLGFIHRAHTNHKFPVIYTSINLYFPPSPVQVCTTHQPHGIP